VNAPRRRSLRLQGFDYSTPGAYYITICCDRRRYLLGEVRDSQFLPSPLGVQIAMTWLEVPVRFPSVSLDTHGVMPNHLHAILHLQNASVPLPAIVQAFKSLTSNAAIRGRGPDRLWQRGYYEHVVRDEQDLDRIREYILNNPVQWALDQENLERRGEDPFERYLKTFDSEPGGQGARR